MQKVKVGILGSGDTGLDLIRKIRKSSGLEIGIVADTGSTEGLHRAQAMGFTVSDTGIQALVGDPSIRLVCDTADMRGNPEYPRLRESGKIIVNLGADCGRAVIPCLNGDVDADVKEIGLANFCAQAAVPIAWAINRAADSEYTEVISCTASRCVDDHAKANVDSFITDTVRDIRVLGGADRGKAIIILNPADPPMAMTDTIYSLVRHPNAEKIQNSVEEMVRAVRAYVPGYGLRVDPLVEGNKVTVIVQVRGAGDFLPDYAGNLDILTAAAAETVRRLAPSLG